MAPGVELFTHNTDLLMSFPAMIHIDLNDLKKNSLIYFILLMRKFIVDSILQLTI